MSDDKTVPLFKDQVAPGERNEGVIAYLRQTLEAAERGEIVAVGIAIVNPADWVSSGWVFPRGRRWSMLGAITDLKGKFTADIVEDDGQR